MSAPCLPTDGGAERRRRLARTLAAAIALAAAAASAAAAQGVQRDSGLFTVTVQRVADGIYVASRPHVLRYWVEGNVTIIVNDRDVVVVEGSGSRESARTVIAEIRRITRKPVRYLINTHGHGDHTLGNQEYVAAYPGVEIIAHPETHAYLTGSGISYAADIARSTESRKAAGRAEIERVRAEGRPGAAEIIANLEQYYERDIDVRHRVYRRITVTPPTLLVDDRLVLRRGARTIEVRFLGKGDTPGDLVVFLPEDRLVVTGDMLVHPIPYGYSRFPLEWRATLDRVAALDADIIVPGHGDVLRGKDYLRRFMGLMDTVSSTVRRGVADGLDASGIRRSLNAAELGAPYAQGNVVYQYYFEQYFLDPHVERLFAAAKEGAGRN